MAEIKGTSGNDTLTGTDGADRISGDRGNDIIHGRAGNDQIDAGEGSDVVEGGVGDDMVRGGRGVDVFKFQKGDGKDTIGDLEEGETVVIRGYVTVQSINQVGGDVVVVLSGEDQITFQNATLARVQAALRIEQVYPYYPIPGTNGDDELLGTLEADQIFGLDGNDYMVGAEGSDSLWGGNGNDEVYGVYGDDLIYGEAGDDLLDGGDGADDLSGGTGNDLIKGGNGVDLFTFEAGDGKDTIADLAAGETVEIRGYGAAQSITQIGGNVVVVLSSGDQITFSNKTVAAVQAALVFLDGPLNVINGTAGSDTLTGTEDTDVISGGGGNDVLFGGTGSDFLDGGAGNDTFIFRAGDGHAVITDFAAGDQVKVYGDLYVQYYSTSEDGLDVIVHFSSGDQITFVNADFNAVRDGLAHFPGLPTFGTAGNDTIAGSADIDEIHGLGGDDAIAGAEGNDTLAGDGGTDAIDGGDGDDTLYGDAASAPWYAPYFGSGYIAPQLDTGTDADTLLGGAGDDRIFAGYGDNADGGVGSDTLYVSFQGAPEGVIVDFRLASQQIGGGTLTAFESVGWIDGSNYDDHITIGSYSGYEPTIVFGMGGNDTLIAGYTTALLDGGDGNDILDGRNSLALQELDGGAGDDILYTHTNTFAVAYGGDGNDTIYAHGETHGGAGNDIINIAYSYYPGLVTGDAGDDNIIANDESDSIEGNEGNDTIDSAGGNDILNGGTGADSLTGGAGNDRFVFKSGDGQDVITDFSAGDILEIRGHQSATSITQVGSDVLLVFSVNDQITLLSTDVVTVQAGLRFGAPTDDTIVGGPGDDILHGGGGDDDIAGGAGADTINGGDGQDVLFSGDRSPDFGVPYYPTADFPPLLDTGRDVDTVMGEEGDDVIFAGYGDDIDGGGGTDTLLVSFQGATNGVTFDSSLGTQVIGGGTITNVETVQWVQGSNFDDHVSIGDPASYAPYASIFGMGGNDTLIGGQYTSMLAGDDGDDTLIGGLYTSVLAGGDGDDTITAAPGAWTTINGGSGNDTIHGSWRIDGGDGNDSIFATVGAQSIINGGAGDDMLTGSVAQDQLAGNSGADTIDGSDGSDFLYSADIAPDSGGISDDVGLEHDVLRGGEGDDWICAGYGDDVDGGAGMDNLRLSLAGATSGISLDTSMLVSGQPVTVLGGIIQSVEVVDYIKGSAFSDTLTIAAQGSDISIYVGDGDDLVTSATAGAIHGEAGNDTVIVQAATAAFWAGDGDDLMISGAGADWFVGNAGSDTIDYRNAASGMTVSLALETASDGDGFSEIENVNGSTFADSLTGNNFANVLRGDGGNDALGGGRGDDILEGGSGNDTFSFAVFDGKDLITDFAAGDILTIIDYGAAQSITQVGSNVVVALSASDQITLQNTTVAIVQAALQFVVDPPMNLTGTAGADWLVGGSGNDQLSGGAGNDVLDGSFGADTLTGGSGNDQLFVDNAGDVVVETTGGGTDWVIASANYTLSSGAEIETFTATFDTGGASFFGPAINLTGNDFGQTLGGNSNTNVLLGMGGDDVLAAGFGSDTLDGGAGNDTLSGNDGQDIFLFAKGGGTDVITDFSSGELLKITGYGAALSITQSGANVVVTFSSNDKVTLQNTTVALVQTGLQFDPNAGTGGTTPTAGDDTLTGTANADAINGLGGNDTIYGLGGNDTLDGGAGNDILDGGAGNDTLRGGTGNDTYHVDSALDKITEGSRAGTDEVLASAGYTLGAKVEVEKMTAYGSGAINLTGNELAQTLVGNGAGNILSGAAGNDTLMGGDGADTLKGGFGADVLWGGAGADLFAFAEKGRNIGNDQVMDFVRGEDKVDLRALAITSANVTTALSAGNTVLSIDADRNGRADFTVTLVGVTQVDSSDFIF